jgi:hypothetical protein
LYGLQCFQSTHIIEYTTSTRYMTRAALLSAIVQLQYNKVHWLQAEYDLNDKL